MNNSRNSFPFTAIIGQDQMKLGLILNVINPNLGGILVFGEKGTAKSTAVRALADLLPEIPVVKGCRFRCDPEQKNQLCPECQEKLRRGEAFEVEYVKMRVVDLPVSATEDRVVGALDLEEAIQKGHKSFEPGVLAEANRGILYVDEVNLLDDHIVDLLLDAAAMGVNTVEREGVSFSHPARFILIGTMNPEEGELRPQLLDRFGLSVRILGIRDAEKRVEIIKTRGAYEDDPAAFCAKYASRESELVDKIIKATQFLPKVEIADEMLLKIARIAIALDVDGHRSDLTLMRGAKTLAAFEGRNHVCADDLFRLAEMVYLHRMKSLPFEQVGLLDMTEIKKIIFEMEGAE